MLGTREGCKMLLRRGLCTNSASTRSHFIPCPPRHRCIEPGFGRHHVQHNSRGAMMLAKLKQTPIDWVK